MKFPPYRKIADFLRNKHFFSDSPEGLLFGVRAVSPNRIGIAPERFLLYNKISTLPQNCRLFTQ